MLQAISPIDGRYYSKTRELAEYFSEYALIRYRVFVEIQYFIALVNHPIPELADFDTDRFDDLNQLFENFELADAEAIKQIERTTNHDVKAVEYWLKKKFDALELGPWKEFIHFALTSQDINNTANPLLLKKAMEEEYLPLVLQIRHKLDAYATEWASIPMLAKTHGQPASPTLLGKEIRVFVERIDQQVKLLQQVPHTAKFGGATGNFNAHFVVYPNIDWRHFADNFVGEYLGLQRQQYTTQIEHYDHLAAICHGMMRINTILIDLCRDLWTYISMEYFRQRVVKDEVGSSAMPHKVNPIDFENAEGNFGVANALFDHLAAKLPVSRLQRDLTDSTVLRNMGVPVAHSVIGFQSLLKGLGKLLLNEEAIHNDLNNNWQVVAEAIQSVLRREGYPQPYEALKAFTRGRQELGYHDIQEFIDSLDISESLKQELKDITPFNYTGMPL
jgi:adenylosuccinate lyase